MKNFKMIIPAALVVLSACSQSTTGSKNASNSADSTATENPAAAQGLVATMQVADTIRVGSALQMKFAVHNYADTATSFCKWHTPFERWMSKYLDIKDENGVEANYKGAMAKRVMPPPADSYIKLNAKDSVSVTVDLLEGYDISKPGKYTVKYQGGDISGLVVKDSLSFVYIK